MNPTLFSKFVGSAWNNLQQFFELFNGKRQKPTYYHKDRLRKEYSADQKWESASVNTSYVAADIVALDSPLPMKQRPTLSRASGKLPKVGMKKILNESQIQAINIMEAQGQTWQQIAGRLIADAEACSVGIDEINEFNFLTGLSNGCVVIADENSDGGLRLDFNYQPEKSFGVETANDLQLSDIERVLNKANDDGNTIAEIWIAKSTYDKLRQTRAARELVATYNGQAYTDQTTLPVPTAGRFDEAFADQYGGVQFVKVDRSVNIEKNGKRTPVKPFNPNKLVFTIGGEVGALVWGQLAEQTNPVNGVLYNVVDQYKLISKYSKNEPFSEITSGQALCLPVIENVDQIYTIDITDAQSVDTTAEGADPSDQYVTIWGKKYTKANFIAAMKAAGMSVSTTATDDTIIKKVNKLSDEEETALKEAVAGFVVA